MRSLREDEPTTLRDSQGPVSVMVVVVFLPPAGVGGEALGMRVMATWSVWVSRALALSMESSTLLLVSLVVVVVSLLLCGWL